MPQPELGFDIWALITDILADEMEWSRPENAESLKALSLACKALLPFCRKHLLSTLLLNRDAARSSRFKNLISNNPRIVQYVQHLEYRLHDPLNVDNMAVIEGLRSGSMVLESISLSGSSPGKDWTKFPPSLQNSLERLITLPTVTSLFFGELNNVPPHILGGCANISQLTLDHVKFTDIDYMVDDAHWAAIAPMPAYLKVCQSRSCDPIRCLYQPRGSHDDQQRIIDFRGLKELEVSLFRGRAHGQVVLELLQITTALEYLELSAFQGHNRQLFAGFGAALSIHATSTLKEFSVDITVDKNPDDPLCGLVSELAMIAGRNILEDISLHITFEVGVVCRADAEDWGAFDSLVTGSASFRMLKSVSVEISQWATYEREDNIVTNKQFPILLESDRVEFRFSVTDIIW